MQNKYFSAWRDNYEKTFYIYCLFVNNLFASAQRHKY